jgi:hypothetical protein
MFLMKTVLSIISFISLLLVGCQPSCCKKRKACAVYDQKAIKQACQKAASQEDAFAHFKTDPFFSLLYPHFSYEKALAVVEKEDILLEKLHEIDAVGGAKRLLFGQKGEFSLAAVRHLYIAQQLREKFKSLSPKQIVIIGAGDGGLCQLVQEIYHPQSITLVDLPEPLALARRVLEKQQMQTAHFFTPDQLPQDLKSDLVISDCYFSMFAKGVQEQLIERILSHAQAGFFFAQLYPKHYAATSLAPKELQERLSVTINEENEEYQFMWDLKI